jgi:hypothetical protein
MAREDDEALRASKNRQTEIALSAAQIPKFEIPNVKITYSKRAK